MTREYRIVLMIGGDLYYGIPVRLRMSPSEAGSHFEKWFPTAYEKSYGMQELKGNRWEYVGKANKFVGLKWDWKDV